MQTMHHRKKVNMLLGKLSSAQEQYEVESDNLITANQKILYIEAAQTIAQTIAQQIQQQAHEKIEGVVSKCLQAVFGDDYGFKIQFERKRGRTEAKLLLLKNGHEIEDAMNADSGGVIDVAALALRLSCLVLSKPAVERILIMDEPFKNLDMGNRENIRVLLEELAEDFKVQFIIVTHEAAFKTGKVLEI